VQDVIVDGKSEMGWDHDDDGDDHDDDVQLIIMHK